MIKTDVKIGRRKDLFIDLHCGGPKIYTSYWKSLMLDFIKKEGDVGVAIYKFNKLQLEKAASNNFPSYFSIIRKSNLTASIKTIGIFGERPLKVEQLKEEMKLINLLTLNERFVKIVEYNDLVRCYKNNLFGFILRIEDISPLEKDLEKEILYFIKKGVKVIQPTYNYKNSIGYGCMEPVDKGLTVRGQKFVRLLNKYKIMIDLSHTGEKTSEEIIKISELPPICSHSFCRSIFNSKRGRSDKLLNLLSKKDGFFAVTLNPSLISDKELITIKEFFTHLEHAINLVGPQNVGIGTDFDVRLPPKIAKIFNKYDGGRWDKRILEFNGIGDWKKIPKLMKEHGFNEKIIKNVCGKNFVRFYKKYYS